MARCATTPTTWRTTRAPRATSTPTVCASYRGTTPRLRDAMSTVEALKQLFLGSGVGWILWLLAACSFVSSAILFERLACLGRRGGARRALSEELDGLLSKGEHERAVATLAKQPAVAASIAAAGLRLAHLGPAAAEKAMQSATALEKSRLE